MPENEQHFNDMHTEDQVFIPTSKQWWMENTTEASSDIRFEKFESMNTGQDIAEGINFQQVAVNGVEPQASAKQSQQAILCVAHKPDFLHIQRAELLQR